MAQTFTLDVLIIVTQLCAVHIFDHRINLSTVKPK